MKNCQFCTYNDSTPTNTDWEGWVRCCAFIEQQRGILFDCGTVTPDVRQPANNTATQTTSIRGGTLSEQLSGCRIEPATDPGRGPRVSLEDARRYFTGPQGYVCELFKDIGMSTTFAVNPTTTGGVSSPVYVCRFLLNTQDGVRMLSSGSGNSKVAAKATSALDFCSKANGKFIRDTI